MSSNSASEIPMQKETASLLPPRHAPSRYASCAEGAVSMTDADRSAQSIKSSSLLPPPPSQGDPRHKRDSKSPPHHANTDYCTTRFPWHPSSPSTSWWRKLTFAFFDGLHDAASLREQDLWPLQHELQSATTAADLRASYAAHGGKLLVALLAMNDRYLWIGGVLQLGSTLCKMSQPLLFLGVFNVASSSAHQEDYSVGRVCFRLLLMYAVKLLGDLCSSHATTRMVAVRLRITSALHAFIFDRILWANGTGAGETALGSRIPPRLINHVSENGDDLKSARSRKRLAEIAEMYRGDVDAVAYAVSDTHHYWDCVLQIVVGALIPVQLLDIPWSIVAGVLVSFSGLLVLEVVVGARLTRQIRTAVTLRVNTMHECIKGIQMVKLNAWEDKMERKISQALHEEMQGERQGTLFDAIRAQISGEAASVVAAVTFGFVDDILLSPVAVFTTLIVFRQVSFYMKLFCGLFDIVVRARSALRRIQRLTNFDLKPGFDESAAPQSTAKFAPEGEDEAVTSVAVAFKQVAMLREPSSPAVLFVNVNLLIRSGELVVIHGPSGGGKSALLEAIRGSRRGLIHGSIFVAAQTRLCSEGAPVTSHGRIAYCAQEPWLRTLSIRENIIFGSRFHERRYWSVLDACGLLEDIGRLPKGDSTLVGPKGINLSGGQKARIALARACYADADLYLLDCPLVSADAVVQSEVFRKCILGLLRNKTVVIVTHNAEIIGSSCVDQVITVDNLSARSDPHLSAVGSTVWQSRRSLITEEEVKLPWRQAASSKIYASSHGQSEGVSRNPTNKSGELRLLPMSTISRKLVDNVKRSRAQSKGSISPLSSPSSTVSASSSSSTIESTSNALMGDTLSYKHTFGTVTAATIRSILNRSNSVPIVQVALLFTVLWRMFVITKDVWMMGWCNSGGGHEQRAKQGPIGNWLWSRPSIVYAFLVAICACLGVTARVVYSMAFDQMSKNLVGDMMRSLLNAPMSFFYTTPVGEVMNRCFVDARWVCRGMPAWSWVLTASATSVVGQLTLVGYFLGPIAFLVLTGIISTMILQLVSFQFCVRLVQHELQVETELFNFISETTDGGEAVVSSLGESYTLRFHREHGRMVDKRCRIMFINSIFMESVWMRASYASSALLLLMIPMLTAPNQDPGKVALVLYYVVSTHEHVRSLCSGLINAWCIMHSAERLREFGVIMPEQDVWSVPVNGGLPQPSSTSQNAGLGLVSWPTHGDIFFDNVHFAYGNDHAFGIDMTGLTTNCERTESNKLALRGVSFVARGGARVGFVGRTGSGKSSLAMALVRMHPLAFGRILVDGVDIASLSLRQLRRSITVIPQIPLFYRCTVREYLDPFGEFEGDDTQLTEQVRAVGLNRNGQPLSLDDGLSDNGENWSLGERQMLCFARAMLKPSRVLVLDESLSAVDALKSEAILDYGLRIRFANSTVLLITHHLDQILGFDSILVMDKGELVECGAATELAANPDSLFYEFLETTLLSS